MYVRFVSEDGDYNEFNGVVDLVRVPLEEWDPEARSPCPECGTEGVIPHHPDEATELKMEDGSLERVSNHWELDRVCAVEVEIAD